MFPRLSALNGLPQAGDVIRKHLLFRCCNHACALHDVVDQVNLSDKP